MEIRIMKIKELSLEEQEIAQSMGYDLDDDADEFMSELEDMDFDDFHVGPCYLG